MAELNDFATVQDLEGFWRPLNSGDETTRATNLLHYASTYLRLIAKNNGVDLDTNIAADTGTLLSDSVKMVILSVVKRAMLTPQDAPPADSWSLSASPYSETMKFTNPSNDLFFKANELSLLGLASVAGRLSSSIGLLRGVR